MAIVGALLVIKSERGRAGLVEQLKANLMMEEDDEDKL